jgi:hypothetical protein
MGSNNEKPVGTNKIISGMFSQMADALSSEIRLPLKGITSFVFLLIRLELPLKGPYSCPLNLGL